MWKRNDRFPPEFAQVAAGLEGEVGIVSSFFLTDPHPSAPGLCANRSLCAKTYYLLKCRCVQDLPTHSTSPSGCP